MASYATDDDLISTLADVPRAHAMSLQRYLMARGLGEDPVAWTRARLREGKNWETIAREMSAALRLPPKEEVTQVRRQLLQKWYYAELEKEQGSAP
jgi:hypothetical protein